MQKRLLPRRHSATNINASRILHGRQQTVAANRVHPFYVADEVSELRLVAAGGGTAPVIGTNATGRWVQAHNLIAGDRLLNADEGWSEVTSVRVERKPLLAYNLTVADFHTFFVKSPEANDNDAVWVHNCGESQLSSSDPLVEALVRKIDSLYPGHVKGVNVPLRDASGNMVTDADILLDNAVIQVKSGRGTGLSKQVLQNSPAGTDLPVIGYGPNLGPHVMRRIGRNGGLVTNNEALLLEVIKP